MGFEVTIFSVIHCCLHCWSEFIHNDRQHPQRPKSHLGTLLDCNFANTTEDAFSIIPSRTTLLGTQLNHSWRACALTSPTSDSEWLAGLESGQGCFRGCGWLLNTCKACKHSQKLERTAERAGSCACLLPDLIAKAESCLGIKPFKNFHNNLVDIVTSLPS